MDGEASEPEEERPYRERSARERHGNTGWYEWTLRELLRYLFGLGVFALLVFLPLQVDDTWGDLAPVPVLDPTLFVVLAILLVIGGLVAAGLVYRAVWWDGGWVDRLVSRRATNRTAGGADARRP